jgi:hypothetical protein
MEIWQNWLQNNKFHEQINLLSFCRLPLLQSLGSQYYILVMWAHNPKGKFNLAHWLECWAYASVASVQYTINKTGNLCIIQHGGAFKQSLLQWRSSKYYTYWVCVCSPRYPPCNEHAMYCHLWHVWLYNIFPHYPIKGTIFGKSYETQNVCFHSLYNFCLKHFTF